MDSYTQQSMRCRPSKAPKTVDRALAQDVECRSRQDREVHLLQCSCVLPVFASTATRFTANRRARLRIKSFGYISRWIPAPERWTRPRPVVTSPRADTYRELLQLILPGPGTLDGCGAV